MFAFVFGAIYIFYYNGGDTVWYWDGSVKMVNLFMEEPGLYIDQMLTNPSTEKYFNYFNSNTGYPPSWIYREPDSFYVCKAASLFGLITLNSFFTITLLFSFFAAHSAWKLYEVIIKQNITSEKYAAWAILFIPSVNFWASGIMKDTIVLTCSFYLISFVHQIFIEKTAKRKPILIIVSVFLMYWIFKTRAFMLLSLVPCLAVWINYEMLKKIKNNLIRRIFIPLFLIASFGAIVGGYLSASNSFGSYSATNIVNTAMVIQKDFQDNTSYSENRYSVGNIDGSPQSMILAIPASVIAALYRPFIWEANNILMLFNGLESLLFIFLTIRFLIRFRIYRWINEVKRNKFLIFALLFVLLLGYFVGFTALIFGALVRFKAPILPFFVLFLLLEKPKVEKPVD